MILLLDFSVIKPEFGLIAWTTILFGVFYLLLSKFAFGPIAQALKAREESIDNAIQSAEQARAEIKNLTSQNEQIMRQAQEEKSVILREAKESDAEASDKRDCSFHFVVNLPIYKVQM